MKTLVIYHSFTGNNSKLAQEIAMSINADIKEIKEKKNRTILTILLDVLFNRIPTIKDFDIQFELYENLIFVAPVWFGKIATPFRALFKELNGKVVVYSFVSISAGTNGEKNSNLEKELMQRTGLIPKAVVNPLISEILPANPKPSRKQLDAYRLSDTDADDLVKRVLSELN